ncbi:MAG: type I restriction-modification system subunit M N-terminal domain-containing protein [Anaerolineales bacterium]
MEGLRRVPGDGRPSEYKNYILVMLFVKYVSDVWADKVEELRQKFGNNEERIRPRYRREHESSSNI